MARRIKTEGPEILGGVLPFEPAARIKWDWYEMQKTIARREDSLKNRRRYRGIF